ncbi:hypothetical protein IscW_ISCW006064 [Ixodes scapularis]|uniref:Uncharacterized protein n=1 Tax=Ixodes scapularis TaxID=6945 RepID=B7PKT4_IXOSC|nr:hypothetical protein IscW_ISCW006064 [Ixodes scapularis]|eukprot:XP_002434382.1 hypothetical protein IscW_ISCW006064 [Ixodes scapularis]
MTRKVQCNRGSKIQTESPPLAGSLVVRAAARMTKRSAVGHAAEGSQGSCRAPLRAAETRIRFGE